MSLILAASALLVGCSGAPSERDVRSAYELEVDQANAMTRKFGGEGLTIKVNDVKSHDCKAARLNKDHYVCQVELDTTLPIVGHQHQTTTLTLSKGDTGNGSTGWIILRGIDEVTS
jgi:hypothetical protein